ncbi:MAG: hypothetical protein WKF58_18660 [Ilumatobacteraceae bacterium]
MDRAGVVDPPRPIGLDPGEHAVDDLVQRGIIRRRAADLGLVRVISSW